MIGFLNSDDTFIDQDSLSLIYDSFDENTDCVFGDLIYTNSNNRLKRVWESKPFKNGLFKSGWMPAPILHFIVRKVFMKNMVYIMNHIKLQVILN